MRRRSAALLITMSLMLATVQPVMAIVYGTKGDGGHPNVGAIVVKQGADVFSVCSGTLVRDGAGDGTSQGSFLTAAHCIVVLEEFGGFIPGDVYITFQQSVTDAGLIPVKDGFAHPDFNQRQANPYDIGVLTFDANTGLDEATVASPGYLDMPKKELRTARFTTVGYGVTRETKKKAHQSIDWYNADRYYAEQSMQSLEKAWLTLAMNDRAVVNGGTCNGDSGGPHFFGNTDTIVSVTVTGDRFCKATDKTYRVDTEWVKVFLAPYLP